jgi:serine protease
MKKLCYTFLMYLVCFSAFSKSDYYIYKGQPVPISQNYNMFYITSDHDLKVESLNNYLFEITHQGVDENKDGEKSFWKIVNVKNQALSQIGFKLLLKDLSNELDYNYIGPVIGNEYPVAVSEYFYVKLKNPTDYSLLVEKAELFQCDIVGQVRFMPDWYTLKASKNAVGNALELSNLMSETNLFTDIDPGFMFDFKSSCISDPNYSQQWALPAINACDAWNITTGSKSVIAAVLDGGIDLNHNEFGTNAHRYFYDCDTHTADNNVYGSHGTHVGGIIGANQNSAQISGIAPDVEMMSVSHPLNLTPSISEDLAEGISWAWENGASVINNSWGDQGGAFYNQLQSAVLENAILNAINNGRNGLGTIVVFASGNWSPAMDYPGNFTPQILLVGATNSSGSRASFSGYGTELDLVAPGDGILSTLPNNGTGNMNGTSMAAPYAAGVVSLILSVNNQLTLTDVMNTIEASCQQLSAYTYATTTGRPNGTWNNETGYGLIDADAAVLSAQSQCSSSRDLFSRDWFHDYGFQPNNHTGVPTQHTNTKIYLSEDVWIRNQPDGTINHEHQNPEYSSSNLPSQLNYAYVRIGNRGCTASSGTEQVRVRWAKAAIGAMTWPDNWNGTKYLDPPNSALAGDNIGTATIPVIQPGSSVIVPIPVGWNPPNPNDYNGISSEPWHFCVVSEILDPNDPSTFSSSIGQFTRTNNNVIWKNFSVVNNIANVQPGKPCEKLTDNIAVAVGVYCDDRIPTMYNISYDVPLEDMNTTITDEGDIIVKMDKELYQNWVTGGKQGHGFTEISDDPSIAKTLLKNTVIYDLLFPEEDKLFKINGTSVSFDNVRLDPEQIYTNAIFAMYPTTPVTAKQQFKLNVAQVNTVTKETIGGVQYVFNKTDCRNMVVGAGADQTVDRGCLATLKANKIIPCAAHWWIDEFGNIISQEQTTEVRVLKETTYTLSVVSPEGCVSTDEVTLYVSNDLCETGIDPSCFAGVRVSPNPVNEGVIFVDINTTSPQPVTISVIDVLTAKNVYNSIEWINGFDYKKIPIYVRDLSTGLYNVKVTCTDGQSVSHTVVLN